MKYFDMISSRLLTFIAVTFEIAFLAARPVEETALKLNEPNLASKRMCRLPSETGICTESLTRWYYSPHTHQCVEFVYGGCNGNENNFENKTICDETCSGVNPCPYVAWVPGCTLKPNGENPDGCQIYDITCEVAPPRTDSSDSSRVADEEPLESVTIAAEPEVT